MKRVGYGASFAAACSLMLSAAGYADVPVTTAFTYQGRLVDGNGPASGQYDLTFTLFGQSTGGAAVAGPLTLSNTTVAGGLFTVPLDFGANAFNGNARWLEIAVKPSAGGSLTTLAPRQPITVTPYALQSRGMYVDQNLNVTLGGQLNILQSPQFVGINRNSPVTSAEVFGITANSGANAFGGMYINTNDATGQPFYGYAANGLAKAYHYFDGGDGRWKLYVGGQRITVDSATGNVGIGEPNPENTLHVKKGSAGAVSGNANAPLIVESSTNTYVNLLTPDASESGVLFGRASSSADGGIIYNNASATNGLQFRTNGNATRMTLDSTGNLGLGTSAPVHKLQVVQGGSNDAVHALHVGTGNCAVFQVINANTSNNALFAITNSLNAAAAHIENTNGGPGLEVVGSAKVSVLEVTGADMAEKFPVSEEVKPGMVVEIDVKHPGELCLARGAYNRRVAGVVSGANHLPAGTVMGNLPGSGDSPAIALNGRVWVECDTAQRAIEPGDFLTTSDRPGYAMAVADPARGVGATLGKAMTGLKKGENGMVLTLINLQ